MDPMYFYTNRDNPAPNEIQNILELLVKAGGHTSKPFVGSRVPSDTCVGFRRDVAQLSLFEDQIDSKCLSQFETKSY